MREPGFAYSPMGCIRVAGWLIVGSLLLFNAVAIARIERDVEARVETAAVETEARIDEGATGILPRPDMCYTANPYGWSPYG